MFKECIIDGCKMPVLAHGLCSMHYQRQRKSGEISTKIFWPSPIVECGDYLEVVLCDNLGKEVARAKIDRESEYIVGGLKWRLHSGGYARGCVNGKRVLMHRLITGWSGHIDHINRDGLDNRLSNLREASYGENARNRQVNSKNSIGYKGVCLHNGKYQARIAVDNKRRSLGHFNSAIEAAIAYDKAAISLHGDFAYTNFQYDECSAATSNGTGNR